MKLKLKATSSKGAALIKEFGEYWEQVENASNKPWNMLLEAGGRRKWLKPDFEIVEPEKDTVTEYTERQIYNWLCEEIHNQFGTNRDDISWGSELGDDLVLDTIDVCELIMLIEEKYDILIFDDEEIDNIGTVQDMVELIIRKL
jgi:acyl carrier protein